MNNKDNRPEIRVATPEEEKRMREALDQIKGLADGTTMQSSWIIDTLSSRGQTIDVFIRHRDSAAKKSAVERRIYLQPVFPLQIAGQWQAFVDNRQAELDDVLALVNSLVSINHMKD